MIREAILKLYKKQDLTSEEASACLHEVLGATATPAQVGAYLALLAAKGETLDEVVASVKVMREKMVRIEGGGTEAIDICGTGGDHSGTFNISTAAALVLAGGGVPMAKHGNRAATSQCGSAEALQALGVKIDVTNRVLELCLKEAGICFLFAPHHHPAMKNVGPYRKEIGIRTLFNIIGPLSNPAGVKRQVTGVYEDGKAKLMAEALILAGSERVITYHSSDGLDEVSCDAETRVYEAVAGKPGTSELTISPEMFGFGRHPLSELQGGDAVVNARIIEKVLDGEKGARREVVVMSAALGFYITGKSETLVQGATLAAESIDQGRARETLEKLRRVSQS